jgi:hypothetical protein
MDFQYFEYQWGIREGLPPAGSREPTAPTFVEALRAAHPPLSKRTEHELASWIVARLCYLTCDSLLLEGTEFAHDTNEVGYKFRLAGSDGKSAAHGAIMIHAEGVRFAEVNVTIDDFQSLVVKLLTDSPNDLSKCEIRVRNPETRKTRKYGWDGISLLR